MNGDDRTFARPTQKIADMSDEELLEWSRQIVNGFAVSGGPPSWASVGADSTGRGGGA